MVKGWSPWAMALNFHLAWHRSRITQNSCFYGGLIFLKHWRCVFHLRLMIWESRRRCLTKFYPCRDLEISYIEPIQSTTILNLHHLYECLYLLRICQIIYWLSSLSNAWICCLYILSYTFLLQIKQDLLWKHKLEEDHSMLLQRRFKDQISVHWWGKDYLCIMTQHVHRQLQVVKCHQSNRFLILLTDNLVSQSKDLECQPS